MDHLFDTCTILQILAQKRLILKTAKLCQSHEDRFAVSNEIVNELKPPVKFMGSEDYDRSKEVDTYIGFYIRSKDIYYIDLSSSEDARRNLKKIRKQYYGWMTDPRYCKHLIEEGKLNESTIREDGFKYKDIGECSLIAIALTNPDNYAIISEDKGRVCAHPEINIFEIFKRKGISITNFEGWKYYGEIS